MKVLNYLIISTFVILGLSCDSEQSIEIQPVVMTLEHTNYVIAENNTIGLKILIKASAPLTNNSSFRIDVSTRGNSSYGTDFFTIPPADEGFIDIMIPKDSSSASIRVIPLDNQEIDDDRIIIIDMNKIDGSAQIGAQKTSEVVIKEDEKLELFAFTSFEEPETTIDILYVDESDNALEDHDLVNNPNQPTINYDGNQSEMGFKASFINSRNDLGLTDGDFVGVTKATVLVQSFSDGLQGYEMSDVDGRMILTFDELDISPYSIVNVSLDTWLYDHAGNGIEYEGDDFLRVSLLLNGSEKIEIFDPLKEKGDTIDKQYPELLLNWNTIAGSTSQPYNTAQLVIEVDCNSPNEIFYFDNIKFTGLLIGG